jgi:hypothetical protein
MYPSNLDAFPPDASPASPNLHNSHTNLIFLIIVENYPSLTAGCEPR